MTAALAKRSRDGVVIEADRYRTFDLGTISQSASPPPWGLKFTTKDGYLIVQAGKTLRPNVIPGTYMPSPSDILEILVPLPATEDDLRKLVSDYSIVERVLLDVIVITPSGNIWSHCTSKGVVYNNNLAVIGLTGISEPIENPSAGQAETVAEVQRYLIAAKQKSDSAIEKSVDWEPNSGPDIWLVRPDGSINKTRKRHSIAISKFSREFVAYTFEGV